MTGRDREQEARPTPHLPERSRPSSRKANPFRPQLGLRCAPARTKPQRAKGPLRPPTQGRTGAAPRSSGAPWCQRLPRADNPGPALVFSPLGQPANLPACQRANPGGVIVWHSLAPAVARLPAVTGQRASRRANSSPASRVRECRTAPTRRTKPLLPTAVSPGVWFLKSGTTRARMASARRSDRRAHHRGQGAVGRLLGP